MEVLFLHPNPAVFPAWQKKMAALAPHFKLVTLAQQPVLENIKAVLAWQPQAGVFPLLPQLKFIQSLGMGVDHLLSCPDLPAEIPISRVVDADMPRQMSEYVLYGVLKAFQQLQHYQQQQQQQLWQPLPRHHASTFSIGVMGYGALGQAVAQHLHSNGFSQLRAWARTSKASAVAHTYAGPNELDMFLHDLDVLVCLLPLTRHTRYILNRRNLALLAPGALLINPARGEHLVEEDLLALLAEGHLSGALLDVFSTEPLPAEHPFWTEPRIEITPHIAAKTNVHTVMEQIVSNLERLQRGAPLLNVIDRKREY